ncbi:enamine deaminase RidA (YjgF/YER057c/UK114 family) [Mesorhizobium jarvisii]
MGETAGSITVQIGGDISAFEAALARAKQQAVAFDAQISAQLNGAGVSEGLAKISAGVEQTNALLAKLTTTGTATSAVMSKIGTATTATTAALTEVAAATKIVSAEMASIGGGGAGMVAGTIAAKDFAAALEATGGNLSKITPGMLGLATANEEVAVSAKSATANMAALGVAETEAAGLGAGVSREFSVLGAEIARGNFSRIPGSLIVMNERLASTGAGVLTLSNGMKALGALGSVIFNPFVLGFLAISVGTEVAIKALGALRGGASDVNEVLAKHKEIVDEVAASYTGAKTAMELYTKESATFQHALLLADVEAQTKALKSELSSIFTEFGGNNKAQGKPFGVFSDAIFEMNSDIRKGLTPALQDVIDKMSAISIANPGNGAQFDKIISKLKDALALEKGLGVDKTVNDVAFNGGKAQETLADVSKGFKEVNASAGNADATIAKLFGTLNSGASSGYGVTRSLAGQFGTQQLNGQLQATVGLFQTVDQAVQEARQHQLAGMVDLQSQFHATTAEADRLQKVIATTSSQQNMDAFFGDTHAIKNASAEIADATSTVTKLFDAMKTGNASVNAVYQGLDMVRQTLIQDGFGIDAVNKFVDSLVRTRMQLDSDVAGAKQMNSAIQAIKDKTVTITVVTQQVGTGAKSIYDVPGGPVGVTRYGGQSDMTRQSYQVPSTAGGMVDTSLGGTSGVTVTRFGGARAAGGPILPGMPYLVGEHGPELVVPSSAGTVIPNGQSTALANPQSAFSGQVATRDQDRMWALQMNIEANTRKTAQLLDEIKSTSLASSSGLASSSSGSSSSNASSVDPQTAQFLDVLRQVKSNFHAAGIVGSGSIGYNSQGLGATPAQIARALVYGGQSQVGFPSGGSSIGSAPTALRAGDPYNAMLNGLSPSSPGYAQAYAQALAASNKAKGFATGGIDSSDTDHVEFFKSPNEKVIIARPDQFADVRPGTSSTSTSASSDQRPITITLHNNWNGNATPSKESLAALGRQVEQSTRAALRSVYGR